MLDFLTSFSAFEISILALLVLIFLGQYQLHNRLYEIRRTIELSIRQAEDYRKESSPHERWIERKLEGIEGSLIHIDSIATPYNRD